jgi:asparagine synthase (glutamine-hydrolysing)
MSGIFGVLDSKRNTSIRQLISQMGNKMSHRAWYVVDTHCEEEMGVGLGRIGIGIFNQEQQQPLYNDDRTLVVFLSGEIYNASELQSNLKAKGFHLKKDSNLELVLRLYQDKGPDFIKYLEGVFVLAIWDYNRRELLIANDRFGLCPLLYAHYHGKLVFTPEMKGILVDPDFCKQLDLTALAEYTRFQCLLGDKTFFEGLKLLPNASLLRYNLKTNCLTIESYWDFLQIPSLPVNLTFDDAVDEASRLLKRAIDRLTEGDHRIGIYLSGGVDSRVILGLIDRKFWPIATVTFGQRGCRDVVYAQQIAKIMQTDHHYFEFKDGKWVEDFADFHLELTEGFHSWVHAHGISILGQVRPLIDVNLSGFGGGQTAIDWDDPVLLQSQDDITFTSRLFNLLCQQTTWPSMDDGEIQFLFSSSISVKMRELAFESFCSEIAKYSHLPYQQRAAYFALCNPDRRLYQYYTIFHRSHFEQRFPFYDYSYFEFVYALPPEMLYNRRLRRGVILKMMPALARIPYDKDNLPITKAQFSRMVAKLIQKSKSYVNRFVFPIFPKHTTLYADYENWLRNELKEWGANILLGEQTLQRNIFNPEFLHSVWRRCQSGLEVHTIGKIAPLMSYEMMLRRYFDESP